MISSSSTASSTASHAVCFKIKSRVVVVQTLDSGRPWLLVLSLVHLHVLSVNLIQHQCMEPTGKNLRKTCTFYKHRLDRQNKEQTNVKKTENAFHVFLNLENFTFHFFQSTITKFSYLPKLFRQTDYSGP